MLRSERVASRPVSLTELESHEFADSLKDSMAVVQHLAGMFGHYASIGKAVSEAYGPRQRPCSAA